MTSAVRISSWPPPGKAKALIFPKPPDNAADRPAQEEARHPIPPGPALDLVDKRHAGRLPGFAENSKIFYAYKA
jgi:hypothetical protein